MVLRCAVLVLLVPQILPAHGQAPAGATIPAGTPLWVKSEGPLPLRMGQAVEGRTVYPTYAGNRLLVPAGTVVHGSVVGLEPDRAHRLQSRLRADFTPFSRPVVQFRELTLADGTAVPLPVGPASDGAPVMQLTPPPPREGGLLRREFDTGVSMAKDRVREVTGPGKKERLKHLLWSQLPYHPQEIEPGTVWTMDTREAVQLRDAAKEAPQRADAPAIKTRGQAQEQDAPVTWTLQAYLDQTVTSATAKVGDPFRAVVAEPVLNEDGEVEVPQGAVLEGEITRAKAARRFGHGGEVRFDLRELKFPDETSAQQVQTTLTGLDAASGANLSLDREGKVQPKPKDKVVVPFILFALAARPLDRDGGDNGFGKSAVASNSLGVVGFIVGTAGGWPNVAAGIGYYGTALALWNRWIKRGEDTTLRRDTRIVVQTTARRSAPLPSAGRGAPGNASH